MVEGSFRVDLTDHWPIRELTLLVGTSDYAAEQSSGVATVPRRFEVKQNYPNPFNPDRVGTRIGYALSEQSHVVVEIFNALGRKIRTLANADQDAGWYSVNWDGRDDRDVPASSGLYFYAVRAGGSSATRSMVLLR